MISMCAALPISHFFPVSPISQAGPAYSGEVSLALLRRVLERHQEITLAPERFALIRFVVKPGNVAGLGIKFDSEELIFEVRPRFRARPERDEAADLAIAGFRNEPVKLQAHLRNLLRDESNRGGFTRAHFGRRLQHLHRNSFFAVNGHHARGQRKGGHLG